MAEVLHYLGPGNKKMAKKQQQKEEAKQISEEKEEEEDEEEEEIEINGAQTAQEDLEEELIRKQY